MQEVFAIVVVERKVENGKLVRLQVHFKGSKISFIKITGDFFMHPEDAIVDIERRLAGKDIAAIGNEVENAFKNAGVVCIGFSHSDISDMVREAFKCGE